MKSDMTLDEIRREGLDALRSRLGQSGMVRFLQQFETGSGDYAKERHKWVDQMSLEKVHEEIAKIRRERKKRSK